MHGIILLNLILCLLEAFMHNELQQKNTNLIVPFKVVTGIVIGLVLVFAVYIFGNYVVAAPLQKSPEITALT